MAVSLPSARPRGRVCAIAGVVDVWRVDLDAAPEGLEELLSAPERARWARIVHERNRVRWARSRGMLRLLLARYLDADPRELRFARGPHGKPRLRDRAEGDAAPGDTPGPGDTPNHSDTLDPGGALDPGALDPGDIPDLRFNLSHSDGLMLVAVTLGREVGVDVECANDRHTAADLCTWTMHEATVKCLGTGLTSMPAENQAPAAGLRTVGLDVGPRAVAALAVELTPPRASAQRWPREPRAGCAPSRA